MTPRVETLRRYRQSIWWFTQDGLLRHRWLVAGIVLGGMLAIVCQVQAIALVALYFTRLAEDGTITVLGSTIRVREQPWTLAVAGTLVLGSLIASSLLRYLDRRCTLALRRDYALQCWTRALRLLGSSGFRAPVESGPFDPTTAIQRVRTDSMLCSRFMSLLVFALVSLVSLGLTGGALLIVNVWLTLLVAGLALVCGLILFRINVRAAALSHAYELAGPPAGRETNEKIHRIAALPADLGAADALFELPAANAFVKAYVARLRSADDSELVGNAFLAIILSTALVGLGVQTLVLDHSATGAVVYIVALPYMLMAFRNLARTVTSLNRFYPMARRYMDFVLEMENAPAVEPDAVKRIRIKAIKDEGGETTARSLEPGDRIVLVSPLMPGRFTLGFLAASLFAGARRTTDGIVARSRVLSGFVPLGDRDALREEVSAAAAEPLSRLAAAAGREAMLAELRDEGLLRRDVILLIACHRAVQEVDEGDLVWLDGRSLAPFAAEEREAIFAFLDGCVVIVTCLPEHDAEDWPGATAIAAIGRTGLFGVFTPAAWARQRDAVHERLKAVATASAGELDDDLL